MKGGLLQYSKVYVDDPPHVTKPKRRGRKKRAAPYADDDGIPIAYEVESIYPPVARTCKYHWRHNRDNDDMELYVRVKWKGFAKPTWEPIDNLQDGELKDDWLHEHQIEIDELRAN